MSSDFSSTQGPFLKIVSQGLNFWIRSKCDTVGDLTIELKGSAFKLVQGKIEGVILNAKAANDLPHPGTFK